MLTHEDIVEGMTIYPSHFSFYCQRYIPVSAAEIGKLVAARSGIVVQTPNSDGYIAVRINREDLFLLIHEISLTPFNEQHIDDIDWITPEELGQLKPGDTIVTTDGYDNHGDIRISDGECFKVAHEFGTYHAALNSNGKPNITGIRIEHNNHYYRIPLCYIKSSITYKQPTASKHRI